MRQFILWMELCLIFFFALRPAVDSDYGWHIRNGLHVTDGLTLGGRDIYSWTAHGLWVAHEWLTELGMAAVHRALGAAGNSILAALVVVATYAIVARLIVKSGRSWMSLLIALPLCFLGAMRSLGVRPLVLELFYVAVVLLVLAAFVGEQLSRKFVLLFTLLFAILWANTHGSFTLLVVIYVITAAELLILRDGRGWYLMLMASAAAAAFLVNPWGMHLLAFAVQSIRSAPTLAYIEEWKRPNLFDGASLPLVFQLVTVAIGLSSIVPAVASRRRSDAAPLPTGFLLAPAFAFLALQSGRHVMLLGIAAAPVIAAGIGQLLEMLRRSRHQASAGRATTPDPRFALINMVAGIAVTAAVLASGLKNVSPTAQDRALAKRYPVGLVSRLRQEYTRDDRLLNEYQWGGFLIERNVLPVFIDGRSELYGDAQLERYASLIHLDRGWKARLDTLGITLVLMPKGAALARELSRAGWMTVASDSLGLLQRRPGTR